MNLDTNLYIFLERLNASIKRRVTIILIGGTALVTLGVKNSTKDIDIVYRSIHPEVGKFCQEYLHRYKFPVHCFIDGLFKTMRIKDYLAKAAIMQQTKFTNLEIKILDIRDIILTKIDRWYPRDIDDINDILTAIQIKAFELDARFHFILKTYMGPKDDFMNKYNEFKKIFGNKLHP